MRPRALAAAGIALAAALATGRADAYCRESACPNQQGLFYQCTPADEIPPGSVACGKPLFWVEGCLGFAVQKDASNQVSYDDANRALTAAFAAWTSADCGGSPPSIKVLDLGAVDCNLVEYNQQAGNANILIFRDDHWPAHQGDVDTIARTTLHFDPDTGQINDADIEVNTAMYHFVTDGSALAEGTNGTYDLQAALTHEVGHFLGLNHTSDANATMYAYYTGEHERALTPDDVAGICAIFPPGKESKVACTYLPEHGFSPECAAEQREGDCAIGASPSRAALAAVLGALIALAGRRRTAQRIRRPRHRRRRVAASPASAQVPG